MITVEDGRNLLDRLYPITQAQRVYHQPRHRQHNFRRQLGHKPAGFFIHT